MLVSAKHPLSNRRALPKDDDNNLGGSHGEHQSALRLYDDDAEPPHADAEQAVQWLRWGLNKFTNSLAISRLSVRIDLDWLQ